MLATDRLEELRADAAGRDAAALRAAVDLVEDTRMRLPFNVSYDLALRGARLPARARARIGGRHGMTEVRVRGAHATVRGPGIEDEVAVEEPLEIRVDGAPLAVTMRTPGHDEELALGFLHGEGLIDGPREAGPTADLAGNIVEVAGPLLRAPSSRSFYTTSSCGVCGKGALEEVAVHAPRVADGPRIPRALLAALPDRLRQPTFARTGGLHATGLFSAAGELLIVREDVGRHNAMDKVIGRALLDGLRAARPPRAVRLRPPLVRARPEGGGRGRADPRRRRRAELAGGPARRRPQHHAGRLRPRRARERLHGYGARTDVKKRQTTSLA